MKFSTALFFILLLFVVFSCNDNISKNIIIFNQQLSNETRFKKWLKDTLIVLKQIENKNYQREILIASDSLSIDIKDSFNVKISKNYKGNNKSLLSALYLLERNNLTPTKIFNLEFVITNSYSVPMVEQLSFEYWYEISTFKIEYQDTIIDYLFIKGNLKNISKYKKKY